MNEHLRIFWKRTKVLSNSFGFQFVFLMALLTRTVWGMWNWRDLTYGDTSNYYLGAMKTLTGAEPMSLVFSPLYMLFYGWFGMCFGNAHVATILHRIAILVLLSSSLLLLARSLLPKAIAWLVVAWWVVLPINWNALYEVHLFGVIWIALGCWAVAGRFRLWSFSIGLALVSTGALLVRNEYALAVAALAGCCAIREFRRWRRERETLSRLLLRISVLPLPSLLVLVLSIIQWQGSWRGWDELQNAFKSRHTLNMAQVYSFSYQQRHPEWTKSPWIESSELMQEQFGDSRLTLSQAFQRNPQAVVEHVLWHLQLLPAGLQLGLFNCHYGRYSPDFTPPRQRTLRAAILSAAAILLLLAGAVCMWISRRFFFRILRSRRGWCWLALICALPPCVVAIITQRPRPSYIFPLSFFLMALCGLCLFAVLRQCKLWRHFKSILPCCMLAIIVVAAPSKSTAQIYTGQPLLTIYQRILPFRAYLQGSRTVFASREFTAELDNYLRITRHRTQPFNVPTLAVSSAADLAKVLEEHLVSVLYLDRLDLNHPPVLEWLKSEGAKSWTILAQYERNPEHWMLLVCNSRPSVDDRSVCEWPRESRVVEFGVQPKNIDTLSTSGIDRDGWFADRASFIVPPNRMKTVELEVECLGPPTADPPSNTLTIYYCGERIISKTVLEGRTRFSVAWREGLDNRIELVAETLFTLPQPDGRQRSMRITKIKFVP